MLTFGSLFAGIGGFDLGLERAGMTCAWQVEREPYAVRVLEKHWPNVRRHDDVCTFPPAEGDWSVDLICGGFPCQDISVAGKGLGLAGARSGLWHQMHRIIGEIRPRFVLVENVAALLGRGMGTVLGDLSEIGYDAEWHVIPASAVGAPHRRERVWIVAYAECVGREQQHQPAMLRGRQDQTKQIGLGSGDVAHPISEPDALRRHSQNCQTTVAGGRCNARGSQCDCGPRCEGQAGQGACDVADAAGDGRKQGKPNGRRGSERAQAWKEHRPGSGDRWWAVEPDVGRVAHGVPSRVDRLRGLGNAVVPQIVELIGRRIIEHAAWQDAG